MNADSPRTRNMYVPLAAIGLALMLMVLEVLSSGGKVSAGVAAGLSGIAMKVVLYGVVLLLGMGLCSWFGHPFDPIHSCLLQLLAVTLGAVAVRGTLAIVAGDGIAAFACLVLVLGLTGYFFSDEPMNAIIAIFLMFAAHTVVVSFLLPALRMVLE